MRAPAAAPMKTVSALQCGFAKICLKDQPELCSCRSNKGLECGEFDVVQICGNA